MADLKGLNAAAFYKNNGAVAFDDSGVLWQTKDVAGASDTIGGAGWYQPDGARTKVTYTLGGGAGERTHNVTYTNNRPYTIFVIITKLGDGGAGSSIEIDGEVWHGMNTQVGSTYTFNFTVPVPAGSTYLYRREQPAGSLGQITRWQEII